MGAKTFILIADYTKQSKHLCNNYKKGVPMSFVSNSIAYLDHYIIKNLKQNVHNLKDRNIKCELRMAVKKAGPINLITDAGHMIYDVHFDGIIDCDDVKQIDDILQAIPGIVETGLFVSMADMAYFGQMDGSVIKQTKDSIVTIKSDDEHKKNE